MGNKASETTTEMKVRLAYANPPGRQRDPGIRHVPCSSIAHWLAPSHPHSLQHRADEAGRPGASATR